jgi:hypothetical protein
MYGRKLGRKCAHLLATFLFLLLALTLLHGQSDSTHDRATPTPDFAFQPPTIQSPLMPIVPAPQAIAATGLAQLTRAAGTIFSGTVASIVGGSATVGHSVETVAITFHVENVIRGATPGTDFTFSQWIGAWSAGQRYRVGERVLLFLYPSSKLGLTSCVAGPVGRFSINASGRMSLTAQQVAAFRRDPVLGGRSRVTFSDFAQAVQQAEEE